jgi:hypothetical protein
MEPMEYGGEEQETGGVVALWVLNIKLGIARASQFVFQFL